ncbi:hypothetical protein [Ascidiaceihabitans sp.]|uniref:hypothetical protein n=1 Tax=Ascidiaceihabitans sp. TaxID=1872644 RepID=UPI0032979D11
MMYTQDSFFTLTAIGQIGLAVVSLALSTFLIFAVFRLRLKPFWHFISACVALWAFVWLSPQVYYAYYRLLIVGLPAQIVIQAPPGVVDVVKLYGFSSARTLSGLGQSLLGWALLIAVASKWLRRNAAN